MTTPLIPIHSQLVDSRFTPRVLQQDRAVEQFLTSTEPTERQRLTFVHSLMTAYRLGNTTFTHQFDSVTDAQYMKTLLEQPESQNGYGYTVTLSAPDTISVTI